MATIVRTVFGPQYRAWRGEAPLALAFWGHGAFVSGVLILMYIDALYRGDRFAQQAVLILFLLYTPWALVCIWRCAATAREPWSAIARLLTVAWACNAVLVGGFLQLQLLVGY